MLNWSQTHSLASKMYAHHSAESSGSYKWLLCLHGTHVLIALSRYSALRGFESVGNIAGNYFLIVLQCVHKLDEKSNIFRVTSHFWKPLNSGSFCFVMLHHSAENIFKCRSMTLRNPGFLWLKSAEVYGQLFCPCTLLQWIWNILSPSIQEAKNNWFTV